MGHFLSIIRKQDFSDLLKRGRIRLHGNQCIAIDNDIEKVRKDRMAFEALMSNSNEFDYTREYVIIHFTAYTPANSVEIECVHEVFPLDDDGKMDFEISFGSYLKGEPLWSGWTHELMVERAAKNSLRGAESVGRIFNLSEEFRHYADTIDASSIAQAMMKLVYDGQTAHGDSSFWLYVLTYQRHGMFPKGKANGYFMDAYHTLFNYLQKRELDAEYIESLPIFSLLERFAEYKTSDILKQLPNYDKEFSRWESITAPNISEKFNILAAIVFFFIFLDTYRGGLTKNCSEDKQIEVSLSHQSYHDEASFALFLLGLKLGFDKTRSCLYDSIKLPLIYGEPKTLPFLDSPETAGQNQKSDNVRERKTESAPCKQSQTITGTVPTSDESIEEGNFGQTSAPPSGMENTSAENKVIADNALNSAATQPDIAANLSSDTQTSNIKVDTSDIVVNSSVDGDDSSSIQKPESVSIETSTTSKKRSKRCSNLAQQTSIPFDLEDEATEVPSKPIKKRASKQKKTASSKEKKEK